MYVFQINTDNLPYEKVGKNEPVCIADEVPFDIPDTWEWVRFCNVVNYSMGKTPPRKEDVYWKNPVHSWVSIADMVADGHIIKTKEAVNDYAANVSFKGKKSLAGTLLMSFKLTVGKVSILDIDAFHNEAIISIYPFVDDDKIMTSYLFTVLPLMSQLGETKTAIKGNTLNSESLDNLWIPLPPLNEQDRICKRIKELNPVLSNYSEIEQEVELLNKYFPEQLKKSILQEAVQGKLVPQDPNDEPASVLLERIRAEKQRLIKEGKIKKDKHESVIFRRDNSHYEKLDGIERCIDDEIPFEIPENWCWTRLGTMIGVQRGASPRPKGSPEYWSSERTPHHWIKISDITKYTQNDALYDTDEFLTDLGSTKSVFVDSDYLITAASGSLGKIAKLNISGYIYDGLMCMCFKNTSLEMDYIIILIQAMVEYLMSLSTGTAWKNITTDILKNLLVPLPPLSEQRRIVEKHRELLDKITLI